ncbi:MAG: SUMF1/EgtB/PvdO family nonheme iron enzyme [Saprospiraceae bacterium]
MKKHLSLIFLLFPMITYSQNIDWIKPNSNRYLEKPYVSETVELPIEITIPTDKSIDIQDIKIYRNGTEIVPKTRGNIQNQTYINNISLIPGNQAITVQYKKFKSSNLNVYFSVEKPTLYLYSIGTKPHDLLYTTHDAWDFANAFRGQHLGDNPLYKPVKIKTLIGEGASIDSMRYLINSIVTDYKTNKIQPQDLIILYISTHGFIDEDDGGLYLQATNYQNHLKLTTALKYDDIIDMFDRIACKKIIFMDACHSGGGKRGDNNNINSAIKQLSQFQEGLVTLSSSTASQSSHEDAAWKNGAFTEAILKGLNGKADGKDGKKDNDIVTLDELFNYVKVTVPRMVEKEKKKEQIPMRTRDELGDLPIFLTKNFGKKTLPFPFNPAPIPPKEEVRDLVLVRQGRFLMGNNEGEKDEIPAHEVSVNSFWISKFEITNIKYCKFLNEKGNQEEGTIQWINLDGKSNNEKCRILYKNKKFVVDIGYDNYPVTFVSWYGAKAYCKWLSEKTGDIFRLPTEAEWEYAAQSGHLSYQYQWAGNDNPEKVHLYGNYCDSNCEIAYKDTLNDRYSFLAPISNYSPNKLGLQDMSGNVKEWCSDWYDANYYAISHENNPQGASTGNVKVVKGGSWIDKKENCRVSNRDYAIPDFRNSTIGFRIVKNN